MAVISHHHHYHHQPVIRSQAKKTFPPLLLLLLTTTIIIIIFTLLLLFLLIIIIIILVVRLIYVYARAYLFIFFSHLSLFDIHPHRETHRKLLRGIVVMVSPSAKKTNLWGDFFKNIYPSCVNTNADQEVSIGPLHLIPSLHVKFLFLARLLPFIFSLSSPSLDSFFFYLILQAWFYSTQSPGDKLRPHTFCICIDFSFHSIINFYWP